MLILKIPKLFHFQRALTQIHFPHSFTNMDLPALPPIPAKQAGLAQAGREPRSQKPCDSVPAWTTHMRFLALHKEMPSPRPLELLPYIWQLKDGNGRLCLRAVSNNTDKSYKLVNIIPFSQRKARAFRTSQNPAQPQKDLTHKISPVVRQLLQRLSGFCPLHWQQTSWVCHFIYYFCTTTVEVFIHVSHIGREFILNNILPLDQADEQNLPWITPDEACHSWE